MTSKGDSLKTNEFLRLRKLRLQQVREQSKDIAKQIRQRAKVEQLRHVSNVDKNKEKEYLQRQKKLVNRLEQLYSKSLQNVGAGHKNACQVTEKEIPEKIDLSKLRGKEAAALLRRKKQEKLDEQKKLLDRKLQAREVANVLSREKFGAVSNALIKSSSNKSISDEVLDKASNSNENVVSNNKEIHDDKSDCITKNDMGTQWEFEERPNEWAPNIPTLFIPNDDNIKNSADDNLTRSDQNRKIRRLDLFALSDEMPSSLRGGVTSMPDERLPVKPSLTLVSEYLQNRDLRLREPDTTCLQKKKSNDLQSIKQTLLRTRASRRDVSGRSNVDHEHCSNSDHTNRGLTKKNSVTMYDHNTRDTRDLPQNSNKLVVRDQSVDDDAYSQALKEASVVDNSGNSNHIVQQEVRNRLAITKQNVDKEYRDTLAFLNSLPKEKPARSIRTAYMDGDREKELKDKRQRKLQQEYKKIEKETTKHHCKHVRNKLAAREQNENKSKSPVTTDVDNNIINKDFQYSWLPIPESDSSMAIHTIPSNINKPGNTVKFSSVDTYHEYRSRHKHTPPTKDNDNAPNKRVVETVIIQENSNNSQDSSFETDTSSLENLRVTQNSIANHTMNKDKQLIDAERIIIYKVMESKKIKNKKHKIKKKPQNETHIDKNYPADNINTGSMHQNVINKDDTDTIKTNTVSFTQLQEGIYKNVSANGDNITSLHFSDDHHEERCYEGVKNGLIGKEDNNNTVTGTRMENGDKFLNRKAKSCDNCKNNDSHEYTDIRASATTSNSSFKTAVNDKANNILLDDGFIKLVGDAGKDARKFYVGASGFLKDDAYEVIIQLRKKGEKISKNVSENKKNIDSSSPVINTEENNPAHQSFVGHSINEVISTSNNRNEIEKHTIPPKENSDVLSTENKIEQHEQITIPDNNVVPPEESNGFGTKKDESTIKPPEIIEKGTSTTFRDSFAIPDNMPKVHNTSRSVASIYTQTHQNSPIPRPILMHLSSTTSTTYMSPPDLILPRYLRKTSLESFDDTYEPVLSDFNSPRMKLTNRKCRCGKCKKSKKGTITDTPPNTSRSTDETTDNFDVGEHYKKCTRSSHKNIRSHKCKNRSDPKNCSKQKFKRIPSDNKRLHSGSNYSNLSSKKSRTTNNFDTNKLNPVIVNYVKKLLALNKEGLKALEIVNQECSAVNTPGSSVIDVPNNINKNKTVVCNKISLEQIKKSLEEQILKNIGNGKKLSKCILKSTGSQTEKKPNIKLLYKCNKKRPVHKVKSLNISKQLLKINKDNLRQSAQTTVITTSPCSVNTKKEKSHHACYKYKKNCPQSEMSPTTRQININQEISNTSNSETSRCSRRTCKSGDKVKANKKVIKISTGNKHYQSKAEMRSKFVSYHPSEKSTVRSHSSESEVSNDLRHHRNLSTPPISISTQTNQVESEIEFMKLAENKLQNMEKIADLTEKCTKRLSNLAKVLEEVRRNKSLAYSQISTSDCTSDSDHRSDKNMQTNNRRAKTLNPTVAIQTLTEALSSMPTSPQEQKKIHEQKNHVSPFVPLLMNIPKPDTFKTPSTLSISSETNNADVHSVMEQQSVKNRGKPPPALSRINLKHVPEGFVIPHELSTVVEVDSPMSIKTKSHTTQFDNKYDVTGNEIVDDINLNKVGGPRIDLETYNKPIDPNDLINKFNTSQRRLEKESTDTSEDSKVKMMDLKYFNEIMLKPFISLKDYAKQYNLEELDGQNSLNGISKDENVNEDVSSLHSESSIPDVMAELLKRNLISEPFKFETTSNANSTTMSSESTLSLLALSKAGKGKNKFGMLIKNKENMAETSVSLSISSNPDLEHAFQKLGMGWASSTLKKTKERLALSSSSNTSSSSIPQFKIKSFNYQDIPELSSLLNISNKDEVSKPQEGNINETPKNAIQQTSLTNSMTVKEFLTNELANKITFSNKITRNTTEDEFISLCETKIPEEMKCLSEKLEANEKSIDSQPSGTNNRARTSTPVQIFKSMAYHSTSSSNTSNGLFSNADDLSSVKGTSNSIKNHSTSDKDDLTIPNYSLKMRNEMTECSKSD